MSQDSTESTAPLASLSWIGVSNSRESEPTTPVDERLEQALAGDRAAIEQLLTAHHAPVYRISYRMMGNHEDAQDAVQETLVRTARNLAKYDPARPFVPWLYAITMNVCRDQMRKRKRFRAEPLDQVPSEKLAKAPDVIRKLAVDDEMKVLEAGLATLPPKERAAIVLRDIEGLSTREVAQTLGSREQTVRSQISRARVKLKAYRDEVRRNEA
jgi:RNA polymerase sigma-70 factor, ECF subfamily